MPQNNQTLLEKTVADQWQTLPSGLTVIVRPMPGYSSTHVIFATRFGSIDRDFRLDGKEERLPRVSLTILRLAVAEMLFGGENKPGVAINEAVELTKKYGADEDYQFVNGLLGAVARDHGLDAEQAEQ